MDKVRYLIGIVFCLLMMGVGTVKAEDTRTSASYYSRKR